MRILAALAAALAVLACGPASAQRAGGAPGDFDFYVLALSWSPSYCETAGSRADETQCGAAPRKSFVVHGLWPQNERGFPSDCRTTGRNPTRAQVDGVLDLMPSPGLVRHQWRKHGTCSGLDPAGYFALAREAASKVTIPEPYAAPGGDAEVSPADVERAFVAANPRLQPSMIAVQCNRGLMTEVRVCLTKNLAFRPCGEIDRRACRSNRLTMPAAEGR